MTTLLNTLFVLCLISLATAIKIKASTEGNVYGPELIVNGGFELPNYNGGWGLNNAPGWSRGNAPIEIGRGTIYNGAWKTGQVCELDSTANSEISQTVVLDEKRECVLQFDYAARSVALSSNGFSLKFNDDVLVANLTPVNYNVIRYTVNVVGKKGDNVIKIGGTNTTDSYGMTIDNVSFKCNVEKEEDETEDQKCAKNYMINGDFEQPNQNNGWSIITGNNMPGWKLISGNIEIGRGTIYNSVWGQSGQVCELDSNQNITIAQEWNLPKDTNCKISFQWAARSGNLTNNTFKALLDGNLLGQEVPADYNLHESSFIFALPKGKHTVTFQGTGSQNSYGVTIDNVKVFCCDSIKVPVDPVC